MIPTKYKIYGVIILLVLAIISYFAGRALYAEYQLMKSKIDRVESIEIRLDTLENRKDKEIKSISDNVDKSRVTKTKITDKQKEDEEIIDNSDVSDDDIDKLLTRFKN